MPIITITQSFASSEGVMTLLGYNDEAVLRLMTHGLASSAGATAAVLAVQDREFPGWSVAITGSGLTYDATGRLTGGTLAGLALRDATGATVARIATPGGLGLDLAELIRVQDYPDQLNPLFDGWRFAFSAAGIATAVPFYGLGAIFEGGLGADTLTGGAFIDHLSGSHGHDTIRGGAGGDVLDGDDTSEIDDPTGNDVIYGEAGGDQLRGRNGDDRLYGGLDGDSLYGDQIGETGDDSLYGGLGNDVLWGGEGDDLIDGGAGFDRIAQPLPRSGSFTFTIDLALGRMTGEGTDRLVSIEAATGATYQQNILRGNAKANGFTGGAQADVIEGRDGADSLQGLAGNDTIRGGGGADLIAGGEGTDLLTGAAGADRFYFDRAGGSDADRITDFTHGVDEILLFLPQLGLAGGALSASAFKLLGSGAVDADDRVLYDRSTGQVFVDADGSGAAERQLLCRVTAGRLLDAGDFAHLAAGDLLVF